MTATTTDGVEVEVSRSIYSTRAGAGEVPVIVRCWPGRPVQGQWRGTDRPTVEAAAAWVATLTWSEVRLSCL
jgi:hypothetical protein